MQASNRTQAEPAASALPRQAGELSLLRLHLLRVFYLVLVVGLALTVWPDVLHHTSDLAIRHGGQLSMLAGLCAISLLGLRYPVRMLPILMFEVLWKAIYLLAFALPLWRAGQVTQAVAEDIFAVALVIVFVPLVPWGYAVRNYVLAPGERWR